MTVKEIVAEWLKVNGYSGLYDDECGDPMCGCPDDDLGLCGRVRDECKAGYKGPPEDEPGISGSSWAIYVTKEARDAAIAEVKTKHPRHVNDEPNTQGAPDAG